ncbi:MAG: amidohydrolase family protein [Parvularculaceae bacterium]|nr:amidohydrolase family protein [Parvularculaceae bacterium]
MRAIILTLTASFAATAALAQVPAPAAGTVILQNARLYTMTGVDGGLIENADVVMSGGVVTAVGQDLAVPAGARTVDAKGRIVTPGLFAPWSQLGLVEIGLDAEANDASPEDGYPHSAALDAADAFNPASTLIAINRAGGVTRAVSAPEPGSKMFGGLGAIVDLSGRVNSVNRAGVLQSAAMGYAGAARNGDTRLGAVAAFRDAIEEARAYAANPGGYALRPRMTGLSLNDLEALAPAARGQQPIVVAANGAMDLRTLIKLKAQYGLNLIVLGGSEAHLVARELAAAEIPVILNPLRNLPSQFEDLAATQANAARLNAAGVIIGFYDPPSGTHNLRLLPQLAGNAVANGLPYAAALAALTINPARMYGLADRYGSVDIGKAADLVVWDGDPLETFSRPVAVYIDGRATSLVTRQTQLRDRYRDLSRGDLPHAYRGAQ